MEESTVGGEVALVLPPALDAFVCLAPSPAAAVVEAGAVGAVVVAVAVAANREVTVVGADGSGSLL